jgi:hypothetical protein
LLTKFVETISKFKGKIPPAIIFDKYREHKEWNTKIFWNLKEKREKMNIWIKSCYDQVNHWATIAKEQISLPIIQNTPKPILQLKFDYKSPQLTKVFDAVAQISYEKDYTGFSRERGRKYISELYCSCENLGNEEELILCLREVWFTDMISMEINALMDEGKEEFPYPNNRTIITRRRMLTKQQILPKLNENTLLYNKTKYWNTKKAINILFILTIDLPDNIKSILYQNPWNADDIPQIIKFLEPIEIDYTHYIAKPYMENKKDFRCRITNIHSPDTNINWIRDPFRILTKQATLILNLLHNKLKFALKNKRSNYRKIINYPSEKFNNLNQAMIFNNCNKNLEKGMHLIEDNNLWYIDDVYINQEVDINSAIVLLQIFKDSFFKNNSPHITHHRCLNTKIHDWKYYHNWKEKFKSTN